MTTIGSNFYAKTSSYYSSAAKTNALNGEPEAARQGAAHKSEIASDVQAFDSRPSHATRSFQQKLLAQGPIGRGVDLKTMNVSELPEEQYQAFMEGEQFRIEANEEFLKRQYSNHEMPDLSNWAGTKPYATVTVGGKVVATIDNQGVMTTSDDLAQRLSGKLPDIGVAGPNQAQAVADAIAKLTGGQVQKASTAVSQIEFDANPAPKAEIKIDYDAMKNDPLYIQLQRSSENYARLQQQRDEYLSKQE